MLIINYNKMEKILILPLILLFLSCSNDDDGKDSITTNDGLIRLELTKNFLVGEKWFLDSAVAKSAIDINGDGNSTTDLISQVPACDLDSFYQFERFQSDLVVLIDGEIECSDASERFNFFVYDFNIDVENSKLNIDLGIAQLLGGLENNENFNDIDGFFNVEFLISPDFQFKLIRGKVQYISSSGNNITVDYQLKASFDNRPEVAL